MSEKEVIMNPFSATSNEIRLMIIEVFTFGQWRSAFTSGVPFIELSRASDEEISLDKYSILVYSVNKRPNDESLKFTNI